ncbi:hypothetical protein I4F81_007163 [Pyropia yezoensis]|uniref:Uncharacterized protein n=1 Tax=Pyropia yezoensis TaxID=2788 RepID=A0ACC3C4A6_PYRYE|nr:hypothetical protein I4F81_007163 [Neopyropia yezoensis]
MVPVASVEKDLNPKMFVACKSPGGQSRKLVSQLSLSFGFCSYEWTKYPCSGIDACANVPRAVLDVPHTAIEAGDADQYGVYERLFAEASSETALADTEKQALGREWDRYTSVVVPFQHKQCPSVLCARLATPPKGKVVTIRSSGRKFLGCAAYSRDNRIGHKNSSLANIQNFTNNERWLSEEREVTNIPPRVSTNHPCMTIRAAGSRFKCRSHAGKAQALTCRVVCSSMIYDGVPLTEGAAEVKKNHHISLAAEEEDVRANLAEEYGPVVAAVPQTALP